MISAVFLILRSLLGAFAVISLIDAFVPWDVTSWFVDWLRYPILQWDDFSAWVFSLIPNLEIPPFERSIVAAMLLIGTTHAAGLFLEEDADIRQLFGAASVVGYGLFVAATAVVWQAPAEPEPAWFWSEVLFVSVMSVVVWISSPVATTWLYATTLVMFVLNYGLLQIPELPGPPA